MISRRSEIIPDIYFKKLMEDKYWQGQAAVVAIRYISGIHGGISEAILKYLNGVYVREYAHIPIEEQREKFVPYVRKFFGGSDISGKPLIPVQKRTLDARTPCKGAMKAIQVGPTCLYFSLVFPLLMSVPGRKYLKWAVDNAGQCRQFNDNISCIIFDDSSDARAEKGTIAFLDNICTWGAYLGGDIEYPFGDIDTPVLADVDTSRNGFFQSHNSYSNYHVGYTNKRTGLHVDHKTENPRVIASTLNRGLKQLIKNPPVELEVTSDMKNLNLTHDVFVGYSCSYQSKGGGHAIGISRCDNGTWYGYDVHNYNRVVHNAQGDNKTVYDRDMYSDISSTLVFDTPLRIPGEVGFDETVLIDTIVRNVRRHFTEMRGLDGKIDCIFLKLINDAWLYTQRILGSKDAVTTGNRPIANHRGEWLTADSVTVDNGKLELTIRPHFLQNMLNGETRFMTSGSGTLRITDKPIQVYADVNGCEILGRLMHVFGKVNPTLRGTALKFDIRPNEIQIAYFPLTSLTRIYVRDDKTFRNTVNKLTWCFDKLGDIRVDSVTLVYPTTAHNVPSTLIISTYI
jgi:hypothetical protein